MNPSSVRSPRSFVSLEILRVVALPIAALFVRLLGGAAVDVSYILLAAACFLGAGPALVALSFSWLVSAINPGIAEAGSFAGAGRFLVLVSAAASSLYLIMGKGRGRRHELFWPLLIYLIVIAIHSALFSTYSDISIFKLASFGLAAGTVLYSWNSLDAEGRAFISAIVYRMLVGVALCSIPFLGSSVGYFLNGSGFQGVLGHPQTFGLAMALLFTWSAARYLFDLDGSPLAKGFASALALALVILSGARTGLGAAALALVGMTVYAMLRPELAVGFQGRFSKRIASVIVVICIGLTVFGGAIGQIAEDFLGKRGGSGDLMGGAWDSRALAVHAMKRNIQTDPVFGIGFGVASFPRLMEVQREPVFGLPISAPVEKGVLPIAVWEETGLIGLAAAGFWVLSLVLAALRRGPITVALVLFVLFSNLAEASLFSAGGVGLLLLICLCFAVSGREPGAARGQGR